MMMAGSVGFDPTTYSLGGCRAIHAAPRAHPPNYSLTNSLHIQLTVYTWSYNS
ncbi:protein of unknown function [Candidatus Nitrosocaldus cavascurensis]|uniref:Uncharacterized protein n=1 Tax=Candidatus Nitrosocaldus cavascurensis TaxID=2058097 RepID=A0A2K5AT62_9ARCH|nr:protein of unknown function [Candidatus Nitrosocaldus cavascurensis]